MLCTDMKLYSLLFLPLAFGLPTQDPSDPKEEDHGRGHGKGHGKWPGKHPEFPVDYTNDPRERAAAVKEAFQYAWDGYYKSASR